MMAGMYQKFNSSRSQNSQLKPNSPMRSIHDQAEPP